MGFSWPCPSTPCLFHKKTVPFFQTRLFDKHKVLSLYRKTRKFRRYVLNFGNLPWIYFLLGSRRYWSSSARKYPGKWQHQSLPAPWGTSTTWGDYEFAGAGRDDRQTVGTKDGPSRVKKVGRGSNIAIFTSFFVFVYKINVILVLFSIQIFRWLYKGDLSLAGWVIIGLGHLTEVSESEVTCHLYLQLPHTLNINNYIMRKLFNCFD